MSVSLLLLKRVVGRSLGRGGRPQRLGAGDERLGSDAGLGGQVLLHRLEEIALQGREEQQPRQPHGQDDDGQVAEGQARTDA